MDTPKATISALRRERDIAVWVTSSTLGPGEAMATRWITATEASRDSADTSAAFQTPLVAGRVDSHPLAY